MPDQFTQVFKLRLPGDNTGMLGVPFMAATNPEFHHFMPLPDGFISEVLPDNEVVVTTFNPIPCRENFTSFEASISPDELLDTVRIVNIRCPGFLEWFDCISDSFASL